MFSWVKKVLSLDKIEEILYNMIKSSIAHMRKRTRIMEEKTIQRAKRIYGICLSVLTVAVAALFIIQIWRLFRAETDTPYTVESVSLHFSQIALPFWLWIAAIVGGGVLSYAFPETAEQPKAFVETHILLNRLKGRLPENEGGMVALKRENTLRKAVWGTCAALCAASAVIALAYLFDGDYVVKAQTEFFQSHAEAEKLIKIFPWVLASLCACAGALLYQSYSLKKELSMVKRALAESAKRGEKPVKRETKSTALEKLANKLSFLGKEKSVLVIRLVLAAAGIALFVVGIFNGGMADVLTKAINICTQCIGLG